MTLVVAHEHGGDVYAVADSKVTAQWSQQNPFVGHSRAKILWLSPQTAVAYAGDVDAAVSAITCIEQSKMERDSILSFLQRVSGAGNTDFLWIDLASSNKIVRIHDGAWTTGPSAWIGDAAAFDTFQHCYHGSP